MSYIHTFLNILQGIGLLGIGLFYPIQNWRAFASRKPVGLSLLAFCALAPGILGYVLLGVHLHTPLFIAVNALALAFDFSLILLMDFCSRSTISRLEYWVGIFILCAGLILVIAINSSFPTLLGWVGLAGTVAFYPIQNLQLFIRKDPTGLSFLAFFSLLVGVGSLTIFGMLIGDKTILLGNLFSAIGCVAILYGIVRWKK